MQTPTPDIYMQEVLSKVINCWNAAGTEWNAQGLAQVYTDDACMLGGRPWQAVGKEELLRYFDSYQGLILSCTIECLDQAFTMAGPHHVIAQGHVKLHFLLEGHKVTSNVLRSTLVLVTEHQQWKISHHHFSQIPQEPPLNNN